MSAKPAAGPAGVSQFTFDAAGRVTKTVDAAANTINTAYDVLGRQTGRWKGAAASFAAAAGVDRVASWTYDTLPGGQGMVASETSWQGGAQYVSSVLAYDARYQVTSSQQTIPGVFGTDVLAGDWKFQASFNEAGQQLSVSTPTGPVDPATPTVWPTFDVTTTGYNGLGMPYHLWQGATSTPVDGSVYVYNSVFDDLGRVQRRTLSQSNVTGGAALRRAYTYDTNTGALSRIRAGWTTIPNAPTAYFQDETLTRDAIGNVTQIADNGLEPAGGASGVKECFIYDPHNRLVRAHSAATATGCVTTTTAASVAAGSVDAYDQVWTFDDINRMKSRTNKLTAVATNYTYTGTKHAVTGTTGGTAASFGYNAVGAMTSRAGTTLGYDALQRLTSYGSSESYLYSTSNQRLIRTAGTTRTLYLPGVEVTDTAGVLTLTRFVSIAGTQVATKTTTSTGTSLAWNCASPQNSTVCQADAASPGTIPARKRYLPYGGERNTVSFAGTDHGFLGQPEDTTGLTYLNNRYYDPTVGVFTSVDPLVGKTGTPYLYANGNPSTQSDPGGLCATGGGWEMYAFNDGLPCHGAGSREQEQQHNEAYSQAVGDDGTSLSGVLNSLNVEDGEPIASGLWADLSHAGWGYYQKLNFHYWIHKLVQAGILSKLPWGSSFMEVPVPGGGRADLVNVDLASYVLSIAEVKPFGSDLGKATRQLSRYIQGFARGGVHSVAAIAGFGGWPAFGDVGVPGTGISASYIMPTGAGIYEYAFTGGIPTWGRFKSTERAQIQAQVLALTSVPAESGGWSWDAPSIPSIHPGPEAIGWLGLIAIVAFVTFPPAAAAV